ncbi:hypothetical protein N0V83_001420 [Neocucurbitaria cava]|uniref:Uncharacterized protein n=1 Tax=Neocucurbitaria cava TaxID=798079 RepID=A0A9W8YH44_9PLEO|nr:hypothetical protein N0V83_001420 [Neocucurbitaria cava]
MAPGQTYTGPTALAHSKHATRAARIAAPAASPSATASAAKVAGNRVNGNTVATDNTVANHNTVANDNTIVNDNTVAKDNNTANGNPVAIMQEIATLTNNPVLNADAELAMAQNNALKGELDRHAAKVSRTLSSAKTHTGQLLELIHHWMHKENAAELKTVNHLGLELEKLFAVANEVNVALPEFLEKQKNNMSLYHASMMNEMIRETHDELKLQHKKVNIQHALILEHHEAFAEYKAQTLAKLHKHAELKVQHSPLMLMVGLLQTEINAYKQVPEESHVIEKELSLARAENLDLKSTIDAQLHERALTVAENSELKSTIDAQLHQHAELLHERAGLKVQNSRLTLKIGLYRMEINAYKQDLEELHVVKQELSLIVAENSKLKTTIDVLRAEPVVPAVTSSPTSDENEKALGEKIKILEAKITNLESSEQQWRDLAKRSYEEYNEILPTYKKAEEYRKEALEKEDLIMGIKLELSAAQAAKSNGVLAGSDAAYWKDKYESLLSSVSG